MFISTSLCPGGAFMICESAAEYDPNLQNPINPEEVIQVREALKPVVKNYDPVMKLINKTGDMYTRLKDLMVINLEPGDPMIAMADLDRISKYAAEVADMMRCCLIKQSAMMMLVQGSFKNDWIMEDFRAHLGTFMKHKMTLKTNGYSKQSFVVNRMNCLYTYDVDRMLALYMASDEGLPDFPISMDRIRECLNQYGSYADYFTTTEDMFNCFFRDPERLARLEEPSQYTIDLDEMMQSISYNDCDNGRVCENHPDKCRMITFISHRLRMVKRAIYDLQNAIIDHEIEANSDCYHKKMRAIISGTADLFYVPMILMLSKAYQLRSDIARRNAVSEYTEMALTQLKIPRNQ